MLAPWHERRPRRRRSGRPQVRHPERRVRPPPFRRLTRRARRPVPPQGLQPVPHAEVGGEEGVVVAGPQGDVARGRGPMPGSRASTAPAAQAPPACGPRARHGQILRVQCRHGFGRGPEVRHARHGRLEPPPRPVHQPGGGVRGCLARPAGRAPRASRARTGRDGRGCGGPAPRAPALRSPDRSRGARRRRPGPRRGAGCAAPRPMAWASSRGSSRCSSQRTRSALGASSSTPAPWRKRRLRRYAPSWTASTPATARRARKSTSPLASSAAGCDRSVMTGVVTWSPLWSSVTTPLVKRGSGWVREHVAPPCGALEERLPSCRAMRALVGVCVGLAALWAGCGGGDGSPAPTETATATATAARTGLRGALAAVKSGEAAHQAFYWTDVAGVRDVAGYPARAADLKVRGNRQSRWLLPLGAGADALGGDAFMLGKVGERLGFDYLAADSATSIGEPPRRAGAARRRRRRRGRGGRAPARCQGGPVQRPHDPGPPGRGQAGPQRSAHRVRGPLRREPDLGRREGPRRSAASTSRSTRSSAGAGRWPTSPPTRRPPPASATARCSP